VCQQQCLALKQGLETCFNRRIEPFNLMMAGFLPASRKTFRVIRGEQGFRVYFVDDADDNNVVKMELFEELSAALEAIENSCQQLPAVSFMEKLLVASRQFLWRVPYSGMSPDLQRYIVCALSGFHGMLSGRLKDALSYQNARLQVLSYLLQEPQRTVANLLKRHQFYLHWNYARRLRHLRHAGADHAHNPQTFCWPERDAYVAMSRDCDDSRVLVTIHMGDFFGAFKCIADALDHARGVISLRREGETQSIRTLSQGHAAGHEVFVHGRDNPLLIVKALRTGNQTLSVLFDLSRDFGETTEVTFFGHRARFVRGPAELAIMGRARIYPFVCYSDGGRDWIDMEPAFCPELRVGESLQEAASRVTQALVAMAERWIRQHPAQWKYLDALPSYLSTDDSGNKQEASCLAQ
jgi:hypothetical protein